MRAAQIRAFVYFALLLALATLLAILDGCNCGSLPLAPPADLASACSPLAPACHFVGGGITPCNVGMGGVECYSANVEEPRCAPDPLVVPRGYPYFVVRDCALCAATCAPGDGSTP